MILLCICQWNRVFVRLSGGEKIYTIKIWFYHIMYNEIVFSLYIFFSSLTETRFSMWSRVDREHKLREGVVAVRWCLDMVVRMCDDNWVGVACESEAKRDTWVVVHSDLPYEGVAWLWWCIEVVACGVGDGLRRSEGEDGGIKRSFPCL